MFNCPLRSVLSLSLTAHPLQQFPLDLHMNRHQENSCQGFHWHGNHNNGQPGGPTTQQSLRGVRGQKRRGRLRRNFKDNQSPPGPQPTLQYTRTSFHQLPVQSMTEASIAPSCDDKDNPQSDRQKSCFSWDKHFITHTKGMHQFKYNLNIYIFGMLSIKITSKKGFERSVLVLC